MAHAKHSAMKANKRASGEARPDLPLADAGMEQLLTCDDSMRQARQLSDHRVRASYPNWLSHTYS